MRTVDVPLGNRSYKIEIGRDLLSKLGSYCKKLGLGQRCAIITDSNVAALYGKAAAESLERAGFSSVQVTIPAGEKSKSLKVVGDCYEQLAAHRLERKSFVVALGGGVVGDLAGFVAATYLRGVPFVQIPTTLLAQVDSSVGGKVGVNLPAGKNLVGAFYQPLLVLCDLGVLDSLPEREFRAGLAEVIKYGIIYDADLFRMLEKHIESLVGTGAGASSLHPSPEAALGGEGVRRKQVRDSKILARVVARCCEIKAHVVAQDETESGLRAILNFGHTIGHGLEAISSYGKYLHGEAISIGQVAAARLSARVLGLSDGEVERIRSLFERAGLPITVRLTPAQKAGLFDAMRLDKKVSGGEIKFVLARQIGKVAFGVKVPNAEIEAVLNEQ